MQFTVKKDKDLAFENFFLALKHLKDEESTRFGGLNISEELIQKANLLLHISRRKFTTEQKEIFQEIISYFDTLWERYAPEIEKTYTKLKEMTELYGDWISNAIPEFTNIAWSHNEIIFYPSVLQWAGALDNFISVGIGPQFFFDKDFISVLIHEMIHVNTDEIKISGPTYPKDSREITNTLIVGKITRKMNNEFGIMIRNLRLAVPFRIYKDEWQLLKSSLRDVNEFSGAVKIIDKYLVSKGHSEVYKN